MTPSDALDGHDLPRLEGPDGFPHRVSTGGGLQGELRPTGGAGDRLGVVAAVEGIPIVPEAVRAHRERLHGRQGAVVGEAMDDRITRTAVHTGGRPVPLVVAVAVADVREAGCADGGIRRDRARTPSLALAGG